MLQTPVSQPYSSSDSSSVILLGKLPSSQKKNSGAEEKKSAVDDNRSSEMKSSIMSIGSFGEELNKLRSNLAERDELDKLRTQLAEKERRDKEKGGGSSEFAPPPINFDSDLFKVMKGSMKLNVRPSVPSTIVTAANSNKIVPVIKSARERECEQKSESNKKSHGSTKNETTCSCPSDAEP